MIGGQCLSIEWYPDLQNVTRLGNGQEIRVWVYLPARLSPILRSLDATDLLLQVSLTSLLLWIAVYDIRPADSIQSSFLGMLDTQEMLRLCFPVGPLDAKELDYRYHMDVEEDVQFSHGQFPLRSIIRNAAISAATTAAAAQATTLTVSLLESSSGVTMTGGTHSSLSS